MTMTMIMVIIMIMMMVIIMTMIIVIIMIMIIVIIMIMMIHLMQKAKEHLNLLPGSASSVDHNGKARRLKDELLTTSSFLSSSS